MDESRRLEETDDAPHTERDNSGFCHCEICDEARDDAWRYDDDAEDGE